MELALTVLRGAWQTLLQASAYILLGLLLAGVLHVVLDARAIHRRLGGRGMRSVTGAALLGIPLPLCSCAVVPAAIELHRKGASRAASLSFLITTPESGADSLLVTWGLLGPVMTIARPVASFLTGLVAGVAALATPSQARAGAPDPAALAAAAPACEDDCALEHAHVARRPPAMVRMVRYAFVELLDDIAFWLVIGFLVAGVVLALVPDDLAQHQLGSGIVPMLLMLAVGVPMYMCASASTPVAAALVAKGLSPGAALVFLLAGPATNAASLVLLLRHFGRGFVGIYLASIAVVSLACGLALDALLLATGARVVPRLPLSGAELEEAAHWAPAAVLCVLLVWRLVARAGRQGMRELVESVAAMRGMFASPAGRGAQDRQ